MTLLAGLVLLLALWLAPPALADSTPPTPTPAIGTGGAVSADPADQGSSCSVRPAVKYTPAAGSNPYAWAQPDWPGFFTEVMPISATPGCSR